MKYYVIEKEGSFTIMKVEDHDKDGFEKAYADNIVVQAQSSMAEALVKFGEVQRRRKYS